MPSRRRVFRGEICGVGTESGQRIVIGRWTESPLGAFTDVMHEAADGRRTLYAPDDDVAAFVQTTYTFDRVAVAPIASTRTASTLTVEAGGLRASIEVGRRSPVGWLLRSVPSRVAVSPTWCRTIDPIARVTMRGVRTRGSAGNGRTESYGATDAHAIASLHGDLDGVDLGGLTDVWPPVHFGFGSTPRTPSIVAIQTTIDEAS
ncbi:MAG: hypothetical protein JWM34_4402 [Ilumatobacteraceae bacterium]|nr:hypothetical protein [Ilumatobacteraceae bacterium]